jgi:membrane-associated protein
MEFIQELGALSYLGVFIISLLANMVIPVPEEISLLGLGYLAGTGVFNIWIIIPIIIFGLFISDTIIYFLSLHGSKIIKKIYQKIFSSNSDMLGNISRVRLERIIIFSRFLVYLRFLAPFLSGYHKLSFKRFLLLEMVSLWIYTPIYVLLGFFLRNQIERALIGINTARHITTGIVIVIIAVFIFFVLKKYIKKYLELRK